MERDDISSDSVLDRFRFTFSDDTDFNFRAFGPPHELDCLHKAHVLGSCTFDHDDLVTSHDACTESRRVVYGGNDREYPIPDPNSNADALEFTLGVYLHLFIHVRGHE